MTQTAVSPVAPPTWRRWLALPGWCHAHRTRLDDVLLAAVIVLGGVLLLDTGLSPEAWWRVAVTLAMAGGVVLRRRHPVMLALAACVAVALGASGLTLSVTLASLAARRRDRALLLVAVAGVVCLVASPLQAFPPPVGVQDVAVRAAVFGAVYVGLPVAVGAYLGARGDLEASLLERAERAEAEQLLRADQARSAERTRIAQEMHDVLGHRISLMVLHAGGLEVNPSAAPGDLERSAALIRTTGRQALEDLRGVLGVLRADTTDTSGTIGAADANLLPRPTLADVGRLVAASREAGVTVGLLDTVAPQSSPPPLVGHTAHRVVQEALTNVHKHAPHTSATVSLSGAPGGFLEVEVANARALGTTPTPTPTLPGTGTGLLGLAERVELVGGTLHSGTRANGGFAVRAKLPWPAEQEPSP